jgi:hypothetical protein
MKKMVRHEITIADVNQSNGVIHVGCSSIAKTIIIQLKNLVLLIEKSCVLQDF